MTNHLLNFEIDLELEPRLMKKSAAFSQDQ